MNNGKLKMKNSVVVVGNDVKFYIGGEVYTITKD